MNNSIVCLAFAALCALPLSSTRAEAPDERSRALADAAAGRWETAEPVLEKLARPDSADADACIQLAHRRLQQGRAREAVEVMNRAAAAAPGRSDVQAELRHALARRIGEVNFLHQGVLAPKLRTAYEKAVALDATNVGAWIGLTQYFASAPAIAGGSSEKAERCAQEVAKLSPFQGALQFGSLAEKAGDTDRALKHYRHATELNPGAAWPRVCLGRLLARQGKAEESKREFEAALEREPGNQAAQEALKK